VGELHNHATRRSGSRAFRTSLEARSKFEKKALVYHIVILGHVRVTIVAVKGDNYSIF
jgi:hypothetical protein